MPEKPEADYVRTEHFHAVLKEMDKKNEEMLNFFEKESKRSEKKIKKMQRLITLLLFLNVAVLIFFIPDGVNSKIQTASGLLSVGAFLYNSFIK